MSSKVLTRFLGALVGLFVLTVITFLMIRLIPGSVEDTLLGTENVSEEARQAIRDRYRLDDPLVVQYGAWLGAVLQGDFGETARTRQPVDEALAQKLRPSIEIALLSVSFSFVIAVTLGTIAALRRGSLLDRFVTSTTLLGISVPDFVAGILLIVLVATRVDFFPTFGYVPLEDGFVDWARHLILPVIALSLILTGVLTRLTRASVAETLQQDHVRTARGKGLKNWTILRQHVIKPSLIPVITTAGLQFVAVIGGVVVIEQVFSIPGLGRGILDAIRTRDYALLQGATLLIGVFAISVSLVVDLVYGLLDPRTRRPT